MELVPLLDSKMRLDPLAREEANRTVLAWKTIEASKEKYESRKDRELGQEPKKNVASIEREVLR